MFLWKPQSRRHMLVLAYLSAVAIFVLDYVTGVEISVAFFYTLPVLMIAWYSGRGPAFLLALLYALSRRYLENLWGYYPTRPVIAWWNTLLELGFFVVMIVLIVRLRDALHRMEAALAAQRRFVADASHELGSPLTSISGNLQLIQRHGAAQPEMAVGWLDRALQEVDRLSRLVRSLLDLAQAEDSQVAIKQETIDMAQVTRTVIERYQPSDVPISLQVATGPALVTGDTDRLQQVLINLLDNALRATVPQGRIDVAVTTDAQGVRLTVADTGVGIPPEAVDRLFDRFYRVDKARSRASGGTGLGLPIVRAIVEAHGGTITVASEVGRGTTFTIVLPPPLQRTSPMTAVVPPNDPAPAGRGLQP